MKERVVGIGEIFSRFGEALRDLGDAIRGYRIMRSALVPRGERRRFEDGDGGIVVAMHPLDAIAEEFADDPLLQLDECVAWITERAHLELDSVLVDVGSRIAVAEIRQRERTEAFCKANPWFRSRWSMVGRGVISADMIVGGSIHRLPPALQPARRIGE